jgi:hypothetical protein
VLIQFVSDLLTSRNVPKSGNEFSGAVKKRVLEKKIGKKVSKQQTLRSVAAWAGGADGTSSLMAFEEHPRTMRVKAVAADDVGAEDMVA